MKTDPTKKLKFQKLISALTFGIGIILLLFMIIVEDEPGAIPLAMIIIGAAWFFITKSKLRSQHI